MWPVRTIAAAALAAAGCASLTSTPSLETRVRAALDRTGLGSDALLVVDNLQRHGSPPPPATPAAVVEILSRPLQAADGAALFRRHVPPALHSFDRAGTPAPFDALLNAYIRELAQAQRLLREALAPFDDHAILRRLADGLPSANQLLAVADAVDMQRLERANLLFIEATARFSGGIRAVADFPAPRSFQSDIGLVVIGTRGNDRYGPEAALIIDPGGDDVYERSPARGGAISVVIDLAGNDRYSGSDLALGGFSAIVDLAGDDRYDMAGSGIGAAIAGVGLVVDHAGDDFYRAKFLGQGAAGFGIGALIDLAGNDVYQLGAWGQGFGLAHGLGLLWERGGNDRYTAQGEPDAFERGSGLSGAQGAAFGFRGLLAGGVGILRDDAGNDVYEAQMFAQGLGYYYALGLLWDRGGDDTYQAFRYGQGNGVHQAVGVLQDDAGDDRYAITLGYGQGMGLDIAVGVLRDDGGDDRYRAHYGAQGAATANGFGVLSDAVGRDRFELGPDDHAWGNAEWYRGLPSVALLLTGRDAQFNRAPPPGVWKHERPPARCAADKPWSAAEALICVLRDAPEPVGAEMAYDLAEKGDCATRSIALLARPRIELAQAAIRSDCWRLQAAARGAFERLGAPLPSDVALPSFLRQHPPIESVD